MFITREISVPGERLDYLIEQLIRPGFDVCVPLWREAMDEGLLRPSNPSHYTHLPPLYPIVLSDEHRERADELGEAGV